MVSGLGFQVLDLVSSFGFRVSGLVSYLRFRVSNFFEVRVADLGFRVGVRVEFRVMEFGFGFVCPEGLDVIVPLSVVSAGASAVTEEEFPIPGVLVHGGPNREVGSCSTSSHCFGLRAEDFGIWD